MTDERQKDSKIITSLKGLTNEPVFTEKRLFDEVDLEPAGVLMPLRRQGGELGLIFVKRSDSLSQHAGEIAFPGGRPELEDRDLEETALREAREEIGLLSDDLSLYGLFAQVPVLSGYEMNAFVGEVTDGHLYRAESPEIESVLFVPLDELLDEDQWRSEKRSWQGKGFYLYFFEYEGELIWGATAHLVQLFIRFLQQYLRDEE